MQNQPVNEQLIWTDDVTIKTTKVLTTTGGTVWDAARRAAKYLQTMQQQIGLQKPGVKVLELGAGCGFLGLYLARNLPYAGEVCLTEQAHGGALEHLRENVAANRHLPNMSSVTTCSCDWTHFLDQQLVQQLQVTAVGSDHEPCSQQSQQQQQQQQLDSSALVPKQACAEEPPLSAIASTAATQLAVTPSAAELADLKKLLSTHWDIIIGSDLIYNTAGVKSLPRVLAALMPPLSAPQVAANSKHGSNQSSCDSHNSCDMMQTKDTGCSVCSPSSGGSHDCCCTPESAAQAAGAMQPSPVFYYAHTKHRFDAFDVDLMSELQSVGLEVQEVVEDGEELPPPSPPPFSSLYPEMRCAMFRISRRPEWS